VKSLGDRQGVRGDLLAVANSQLNLRDSRLQVVGLLDRDMQLAGDASAHCGAWARAVAAMRGGFLISRCV
jgi:hypothetical protein